MKTFTVLAALALMAIGMIQLTLWTRRALKWACRLFARPGAKKVVMRPRPQRKVSAPTGQEAPAQTRARPYIRRPAREPELGAVDALVADVMDGIAPLTRSVAPEPPPLAAVVPIKRPEKPSGPSEDLISAMVNLGYKKSDALRHAQRAYFSAPDAGLAEQIKLALASAQGRLETQ